MVMIKITLHRLNRAGREVQNFSLIVLISFPTAISASFSFIQANPIRVEFSETEPELWMSPLDRINPCGLSFSVRDGNGIDLLNFAQMASPPSGILNSMN